MINGGDNPVPARLNMTLIIVALITALPATIASITAVALALDTNAKVEKVHVATNSMKDALVAAARKEGLEQGAKIQKDATDRVKP